MNGTEITYDGYRVSELEEIFETFRDRHDDTEGSAIDWSVFGEEMLEKVSAAISFVTKRTPSVEARKWKGSSWVYENGDTLHFESAETDMFILTA